MTRVQNQGAQNDKNIFHYPMTAWVALMLSLVFTLVAYLASLHSVEKRSHDRFKYRSERITNDIKDRMMIYEQTLRGGVGLFRATGDVSREAFHEYVETLDINTFWPGIQGMGYAVPVKPSEKETFSQKIRDEGYPEFRIYPEEERSAYSAIIYLEPFDWRNQRAFGYDMWSNDMRRAAMIRARDQGVAATSGIITLVQETNEDIQKGFLMYLPVYKPGLPVETVEERRDAFMGWVYSPFRAGDLMRGIIGANDPEIEFEIFDGTVIEPEALLYDSNNAFHLLDDQHNPVFSKSVQIELQGHVWTLYLSTPDNYETLFQAAEPRIIAIGGIILDVLLFYVIWLFYFLQKKASSIAAEMTRDLELTKQSLEVKVKNRTAELEKMKSDLEKRVEERTAELEDRMQELQIMNTAMVDRELNADRIKKENELLRSELAKYKSQT